MPTTSRKPTRRTTKAGRAARGKTSFDHEGHVDGCDIDFTESAPTTDAELPPAKGGVATVRRARRTSRRRHT
jgi:hypothetical protein